MRRLGVGPVRAGGTARSGDKYHSVTQLNEEAFLGQKSRCKKLSASFVPMKREGEQRG